MACKRSAVRSRLAPPRFALRATRGAATAEPEGRSVVPGEAPWRRRAASTKAPSRPRKLRRPLLHEARHALFEIAPFQRDLHFTVGVDGGLGERLERHV